MVKFLGDGALAEFPSTEQAVRSADALRADFTRVAEAESLGSKELRIGVHVGDVRVGADGDLLLAVAKDWDGVFAAVEGGSWGVPFGSTGDLWDPLFADHRDDPRFRALVRSRNLELPR